MQSILPIVLRPLVRFCMRHSIKLGDLVESLKAVYVEVAREQLADSGSEISGSRMSVMTGVHRKDVARLLDNELPARESKSFVTRVVGAWRNSREFCGASGKPRVLSFEGKQSEFGKLVSSVSVDLNPYTVLFELERIGAVQRTRGGLKLVSRLYNPLGDKRSGFELLASDMGDLMEAVEENLQEGSAGTVPNLHIKTEYDNIPATHAVTIREWCLREGSAFHQRARNFLSQFDRDLNPSAANGEGTIRVAVGAFSRIHGMNRGGEYGQ